MSIENQIMQEKIIAVTVLKNRDEVRYVLDALLAGGVRVLELALRNDFMVEAIQMAQEEYPEMLVGAGTVIRPDQVETLSKIGIPFAVAPGLNRRVIEAAQTAGLPFFPGIATPSDIETALEYDIRLLKFFPAEPMGGLSFLQSMNAPYKHLGLQYIPLGGLNGNNLPTYLDSPLVGAVGGSWIASRKLIDNKDWNTITENARDAIAARDRACAGSKV